MKIKLKLYYGLEKYIKNYDKENGMDIKLNSKENIKSLINHFIPKDAWGVASIIVLVNKKVTNHEYLVKDGDIIEMFPISGGG
jgi:molybdopterin converting factor small subunit